MPIRPAEAEYLFSRKQYVFQAFSFKFKFKLILFPSFHCPVYKSGLVIPFNPCFF